MFDRMNIGIAEFLKEFAGTVAGRAMLDERRARAYHERQTKVERVQELRRVQAAARPKYLKEIEGLELAATVAQQKAADALEKVQKSKRDWLSRDTPIEVEARRLACELRDTADERIDEARRRMNGRWNDLRRRSVYLSQEQDTGLINVDTGKKQMRLLTNHAAIPRVVAAVNVARAELDRLKLEAPEDLDGAIAAIEARVPWDSLTVVQPVH